MMISLSDQEAAILLGATLMHWGVPFHSAPKRELTEDQQTTVDAVSTWLIAWREASQTLPLSKIPGVPLSDHEITLLIEVVEDCLAECGNDTTELTLHLKTSARQEVETLLTRLRRSLPTGAQNSAESAVTPDEASRSGSAR
jgi:hypothetical protein